MMASTPNNTKQQPYKPVSASDAHVAEDVIELQRLASSNLTLPGTAAAAFGILFVTGSIFYGQHCAQVMANEIHGTVYWSPQLAAAIAALGLMSQVCLASIPFLRKYQEPILERYRVQGFHTTAKVLKREIKTVGKKKIPHVVLVYQTSPSTYYAKKMEVEFGEFSQTSFPIVLIPGVPTSAILTRTLDALGGSSRYEKLCCFSLLAPFMWILAVAYGVSMEVYSSSDFWTQWGLGILFMDGLLCSIMGGYVMGLVPPKRWLDGGSISIDSSRLPPDLFGENGGTGAMGVESSIELV